MSVPIIARETASDPTTPAEVTRVDPATGGMVARRDVLAVEEPLEIHLNGWRWLVTMRTPGDDADLVLGMLASEGVVADVSEVEQIVFRRHPEEPELANVVDVRLARDLGELTARLARNQTLAAASCGLCGASSVAAILRRRPALAPGPRIPLATLAALPGRLGAGQAVFGATGGVHAAGLFAVDGTLVATREDVGRHNAVDKVVGWRLRARPAVAPPVLFVSGRASFEIVQKAFVAGIPVVAAVSAPSSLAVKLAADAGMTLAGFVRGGGFNVYAGGERLDAAGRDPGAPGADPLDFVPRDVRTALDAIERKISLADWRALGRDERSRLVALAAGGARESFAAYLIERVTARTGSAPRRLAGSAGPR